MSARTSTRSVHAEEWRSLVRSALIAVGTIAATLLLIVTFSGNTGPLFAKPVAVAAAVNQSCALTEEGAVYCWGEFQYLGARSRIEPLPRRIADPSDGPHRWQSISFSDRFCAIDEQGAAYCSVGARGFVNPFNGLERITISVKNSDDPLHPRSTSGPFAEIAFSTTGGCYLDGSRRTFACDFGVSETAPDGTRWEKLAMPTEPFVNSSDSEYVQYACALRSDGVIRCASAGEMGGVPLTVRDIPLPVTDGGSSWAAIGNGTAGEELCAASNTATLYCWWGDTLPESPYELPDGIGRGVETGIADVAMATNGSDARCFLFVGSGAACVGGAPIGGWDLIGSAEESGSAMATVISEVNNLRLVASIDIPGDWVAIALGYRHGCGLWRDTTVYSGGLKGPGNGVYCWGDNRNSQLGISGYDSTGAPRWVFGERAPYDLRRERAEVYP